MTTTRILLLAFVMSCALPGRMAGQTVSGPDTVVVKSGALTLRAVLWRPASRGPFPAVLFNHGSGHASGTAGVVRDHRDPNKLGPVFARHGYVFLYLFRRGDGLSVSQGTASGDLMDSATVSGGQEARDAIQTHLLETDEMSDALAGLAFLRALPTVDAGRVAVVGHSFGGSLSLLMAERDRSLRAAVVFSAAGYSWDRSQQLRERLLAAVDHLAMPVFFIHAANDYSVHSGMDLAAEMMRLGKVSRIKIYPQVGRTADDGHDFVHTRIQAWEPDVFAFLDEFVKRARG
jgi:dienelactone hydrolase